MIYFETKRLIFRDWKEEDLQELDKMNKDKNVMRYFPNILSEKETEDFYERIQSKFKELGYGFYAVETKCNGEFIGFIGFNKATFEADFTPCVEIGWRLKQEAWGKGYATEGAKACLAYGFNELHFREVYSFTAKINLPSQKVMQKIGMEKVKAFNHPRVESTSPLYRHVLYVIS